MNLNKKTAAIKAAAKYSTDSMKAVLEYMRQSGQTDTPIDLDKLHKEMLDLLPKYRHPYSPESEYMIFYDPEHLSIGGTLFQEPSFLKDLIEVGVPDNLLDIIKNHVHESEKCKAELLTCKNELNEYKALFANAEKVYNENHGNRSDLRSDTRNALVVQALGLSTGKRVKDDRKRQAYFDYVTLIRKKGMSREDAVEELLKKYKSGSHESIIKGLYDHRATIYKYWEQQKMPKMVSKIKAILRGMIPSRNIKKLPH